MSEWQPIETAPPYKTLLTIHEGDLYPVCAFYSEQDGERHWMRVIEGPEDVIRTEDGDHGSLYRPPTHWQLPPESPLPSDAEELFEALENMLGDLYLFGLAEIKLEDIWEGSARDAMRVLKRLKRHRRKDPALAIGQKPKAQEARNGQA